MSVLGDVFGSLRAMSQLQLLLAFLACTGYALAQGALVNAKGRRIAGSMALLAAAGFAIESSQWMYAAMLATFAIAGLGVFVASAWMLSRALGLTKPRAVAEAAELADSAAADVAVTHAQPAILARALPQHNGPAHSV